MADLLYNPSTLTVMIVDDQDPIRKSLKRVLQGMGFGEIIECKGGEDALKILGKKPVDLMILDLYMRTVSGFEVLEYVRNRDMGCDIPVIVVTGEASKEEIVKVADMGAEDYLLKPFQAMDLEKKVVNTLNAFYSPKAMLKTVRNAERVYLANAFDDALKLFDQALGIDPNSARAAHGKALTLAQLGRQAEALKLLQSSSETNHSYHKNYSAIADILLKQNKVKDAIEAMRRELAINPKQVQRQVQMATLLIKEGDALGAVEHFRVALQEDPKRLNALMGMGQAYAMSDNLDKALYYFKRVRRYHPGITKALDAAVRCALAANEPKKAELLLKDEKAAHPERNDTYVLLASLLLKQEREDEALQVCNDLIEREPENSQAMRMKAMIFLKKRDFTNALGTLQVCAKIGPSAEVFAVMGETLLELNKIPEALDALNKAVSMNNDNPHAFLMLAEAHRKTQQWAKAALLYRRAAQLGANKDRCAAEAKECGVQVAARRGRPRAAS